MADNVTANSGSGGATFRTDDDATAHWPYVKLAYGPDNTQNIVGSTSSNALPVALSDTDNAVLDTINTAVELIDDAVHADDAAFTLGSDKGVMMMGFAGTQSVNANDAGAIAMDTDGAVHISDGGNSISIDDGGAALDVSAATVNVASASALDVSGATVTVDLGANNDVTIDNSSMVKAADSVAGGTDAGIPPLAVRDDSLSALTPAEGDYVPLRVNSTGALHVTGGGGGTEYNVDDAGPTVVTMAGAVRDDTLTTLTEVDGDATLLRVSSTGALHVTGGGGGTEYTEDVATANPIVGTATMMERDDALSSLTPVEGDWASLRCSAEGALWTQDFNSDQMRADLTTLAGAVSTQMQVDVVAALPAGTNAIGKLAANSGVDIGDVDVTSISAGSNLVGDVGISGARTSGGTTLYKNIDVDESEDQVKGSAGQLYWIHAFNATAAVLYLKIYNATAASVTVGTTVPDMTFPIPTQGDTNGAGFVLSIPNGIAFGTAITLAATTGVADNDSGAPAANAMIVNLGYA